MLSNKEKKGDHFNFFQKCWWFLYRRICSDEIYSKYLYRRRFGREPDLDNPKSFNEKIQWLKLYDRNPLYSVLADKFAVREYVNNRVGEKYLNELIGIYDKVEEIPIASLPNEFVLKVTHGSGWNIICPDKTALDWRLCKDQLNEWLRTNYYKLGREWVYKNIPPRIICEECLRDEHSRVPKDFKFFCFHGTPQYIQVDVDRFGNYTRAFYSPEWKRLPFELNYPSPTDDVQKLAHLEEMLEVASSLSEGIPFCRVDLYSLPEIIFGEITFYPENGQGIFFPEQYDCILGDQLSLPSTALYNSLHYRWGG